MKYSDRAQSQGTEGTIMDVAGKKALVTGANRGLGRAFAEALLEAGASKVYAGARDPSTVSDPRLTPVRLDVTSSRDVAAAAKACSGVEILINNAGAMLATGELGGRSEARDGGECLRHAGDGQGLGACAG